MTGKCKRSTTDILKPKVDNRKYEFITLENDLDVLLISDPETETSSASMDVRIGSFADPKDLPGLAHFCEHMLFLGTKKYPNEDSYSNFIANHGGSSNAYTSETSTNYHFDIESEFFAEALDRFAQFFIDPLFLKGCVEREVKAVHSEYCGNLQSDTCRLLQILHTHANPEHPYSSFHMGNIETLDRIPKKKGIDIRMELVKFYERYYSSNMMKLCIVDKAPITQLKKWVIKNFCHIENKIVQLPKQWFEIPMFSKTNQIGKMFRVIPVKQMRKLILHFPIKPYKPVEHGLWKKPTDYIGYLLGHEVKGTVYHLLKYMGWITSLSVDDSYFEVGQQLVEIEIILTQEGEDHIYDIIDYVFQYISLIKSKGIQKKIWEEQQALANVDFHFMDKQEPIDMTSDLSTDMHYYPPKYILSASSLLFEYDEDCIKSILENYLKPTNLFVFHVSKKYENLFTSENSMKEKWLGSVYDVIPLEPQLLKKWNNPSTIHKDFNLPIPNEFITTNIEVKANEKNVDVPFLLKKSIFVNLHFKQDNVFRVPKVYIYYRFVLPNPKIFSPIECRIFSKIVCELIKDEVNDISYMGLNAGYHFCVESQKGGIVMKFSGYSQKIYDFHMQVFERIVNFVPEKLQFEKVKEKYILDVRNEYTRRPSTISELVCTEIFFSESYSVEDRLRIANDVTIEKIRKFLTYWFSDIHGDCLIHGDMVEQDAIAIIDKMENLLNEKKAFYDGKYEMDCIFNPVINLEKFTDYKYKTLLKNEEDINCCVDIIYQIDLAHSDIYMLLSLFDQVCSSHHFHELRTKEQLGYDIMTDFDFLHNTLIFRSVIQSEDKTPEYILKRNDLFFHNFEEKLKDMNEKDFNDAVHSLKASLIEKDQKMVNETDVYWEEIIEKQFKFDRKKEYIHILDKITKKDLISFFNKYIKLGSQDCKRVIILLYPRKPHYLDEFHGVNGDQSVKSMTKSQLKKMKRREKRYKDIYPSERKTVTIDDIQKFKTSLQRHPVYIRL